MHFICLFIAILTWFLVVPAMAFHKCPQGNCPGGDPGPGHGPGPGDICETTHEYELPGEQPLLYYIAAFGDSVMWGQGLLYEDKFTYLVLQNLRSHLNRAVRLVGFPHSGASIDEHQGNPPPKAVPEYPNRLPTITRQAACLGVNEREQVNLVLVDGCANDLDLPTKLLKSIADISISDWQEWVEKWTKHYCNGSMTNLLRTITTDYPSAKIAVTGYFPLISKESDPAGVLNLFEDLGLDHSPFGAPVALRNELARRSDVWVNASRQYLIQAVTTVNGETGRVVFVDPGFEKSNAAYTPNSLLWHLEDVDPWEAYRKTLSNCDIWCQQASSLHPNAMGAEKYAEKIVNALGYPYIPVFRTRPAARLTALARLPKQLDTFAVGYDGNVYTANYNDERGWWNGWFRVGGPVPGLRSGDPVTVLARPPGDGHWLDAFVIGDEGQVFTASYNDERGTWNGWFPILDRVPGFPVGGHVTVLARLPGLLDVFVWGRRQVYTAHYNDQRGTWNGWFPVASPIPGRGSMTAAPITVLARPPGGGHWLDAFLIGEGGQLYQASYNDEAGTWSGWSPRMNRIPGVSQGMRVTVVARLPRLMDAWVTGADGQVYTATYNDQRGTWVGWTPIMGRVPGLRPGAPVTVLARPPGNGHWLDAFVIGEGGQVFTASYNDERGTWVGWTPILDGVGLPGTTVEVLARGPGLLDVWVVGKNGRVQTANFSDSLGYWRGWFSIR